MKMSKKMISAMLAAAMCVSLTAPAFAATDKDYLLKAAIASGHKIENAQVILETESGAQYSMNVYAVPAAKLNNADGEKDGEYTVTYIATTEGMELTRAGSYTFNDPEGWFDDGDNVYFLMSLTYETSTNEFGGGIDGVRLTRITGESDIQQTGATVTDGFVAASCSYGFVAVQTNVWEDVQYNHSFNISTGFDKYVPKRTSSHVCATWTATVTQRNSVCTVHYIAAVPGCSSPSTSFNE